ncbi:MAG TPA: asparagine synthase-related protein [Thermoanaerobaculia bacterium]|nr:asparagine synthase-related protein [Thermoanaerobaculia bacterium]
MDRPIHRVLDLIDPDCQQILSSTVEAARERLLSRDPGALLGLEGSFALWARDGENVVLARSLDRPLRYFLAKQQDGPLLVLSDRIDRIREALEREGLGAQFHPSYTRMVPAHHVTTLRLIGCPDPSPTHRRFFDPPRGIHPPDLDRIGERYVAALLREVSVWLDALPEDEPIGVAFSGGADSGAVLLATVRALLDSGRSAARLKAFTLAVEGGGSDLAQARDFLRASGLEYLHEVIDVPGEAIDPWTAIEVIEDYKPLDVDCAAVALALFAGIRERYPPWRHLADGDGGDENFKDYPLEAGGELTIRSVVSNRMLYQEGWGVDAVKHSQTYSGGLSRGCVRTWAPARRAGFAAFSPHTRPRVVAEAEAIPWGDLTGGEVERLYALKGEILRRGVARALGLEMPVFPKNRFQDGALPAGLGAGRLGFPEARYRRHFAGLHGGA